MQPGMDIVPGMVLNRGVVSDALLPIDDIAVRLPVFEGPLDLLLFLIRRNEVDIYDIPIETVTRQYLDTLYAMENLNLEVAGEFFVMAATLMYIKSRMLLPKQDRGEEQGEEEDGPDPRWELVQQLVEYKRFKETAEELGGLIREAHDFYPRLVSGAAEPTERPLRPTDRIELWNAFNAVLRRLTERIVVGEIHDEPVTVADRMEAILDQLKSRRRFRFSDLFSDDGCTIPFLAATFLAILELSRLGQLRLEQSQAFADIDILAAAEPQAPAKPLP